MATGYASEHGTSGNRWPLDINWGTGSQDEGRAVVASAAGTVRYADQPGDVNNTVWIDHGAGWSTVYRHMDPVIVVAGQSVASGQRIGSVSNAGASSPHLHYEQLSDGVVVQAEFNRQVVPDVADGTSYSIQASTNCPGAPAWALISLSNGSATGATPFTEFRFGDPGDRAVRGDWDGDGTETVGVFRQGSWYLNNSNDNSPPEISFGFGNPGDVPLVGDWDGDGIDSVGVWRSGAWYLRATNASASSFVTIGWGNATGDTPIVGDWDGTGTDTPGIVRTTSMGNEWIFNNTLTDHTDSSHRYGNPGDAVVVGDWDGNGTDTPAVIRGNTWYLDNGFDGVVDRQADYGNPGDLPFPGDWDGVGGDSFGILRF